jgi:hypothetical protein
VLFFIPSLLNKAVQVEASNVEPLPKELFFILSLLNKAVLGEARNLSLFFLKELFLNLYSPIVPIHGEARNFATLPAELLF